MKDGKIRARRLLGTAAAATLICFLSALCNGASSGLNGLVLTGGTLNLDFADPANNLYTTTLDRLDVLTWSGGSGALAGQNLVFVGPITSVDTCTEPVSSFGQTSLLYPGQLAAFANRTATTMTSITTGGNCDYFVTPNLAYSQTTVYTAFPAGDPDVNEFRVVRTFPSFNVNDDGNFPPTYDFNPQYMGYVPAVSSALFGTVLYPNTAGTITTAPDCDTDNGSPYTGGLDGGCVASDWAGTWFADDNGSGSGIAVFRDASSTTPAVLNVFFPPMINVNFEGANANQNLTMIAVRPAADSQGLVPSVTETEWVCVYDPTTWPAAARTAGTLPTGCAQRTPTATATAVPQFAFTPAVNVTPGTLITSNVVHLSGLGTSSISITGGSFSLNGAPYGTATQVFSGNADLTVQVTSAANEDNETELALASAVVTINGVSSEFLVVSSFNASITVQMAPITIPLGQSAELTWNTYEVNTCVASGAWSGAQTLSGSTTVTPTAAGTYTYTLQCTEDPPHDDELHATVHAAGRKRVGNHTSDTDPILTGKATLTVTAGAATPAPTVTLAATPTSVTLGSASTLTWSSSDATACTASGAWTGAQATSGTSAQTPAGAGANTYTLTCSGAGGSANASATVTATAPAPTVTIAVSPASIVDGGSASLSWSSTNATTCTASGAWSGTQASSGVNTESPAASGSDVYTLTCTGAGGTANASATLTVNAPTTVVSTSSGRIGGGGAIDLASLLGLLSLTWLVRGRRRILPGLAVAIAAVLIMSPFQSRAADEFGVDFMHGYIGIRAGESMYQPSVNSILTSVGPDAADISSLSIDKHQFGGVVYAGVPIWHSLSLEIGYAQIGQFPLSMTTVTATGPVLDGRAKAAARGRVRAITGAVSVDAIAQQVVDAAPPAGRGVTLGFALPIDITSRISVEPRFAALVYQSKQTLTTPDATVRDDFWGSGFVVGGTVTARVFRSLYMGAGVDCFHQTRACNAVLVEGVIEYRFGH